MSTTFETVREAGSVIPHVWFDAIGRIVPGFLVIGGLYYLPWGCPKLQPVRVYLPWTTGVEVGASLFFITVAAYLIGLLLGSLSYWLVEVPFDAACRLRIPGLSAGPTRLLADCLGEHWREDTRRVQNLCSYLIWEANCDLAVMFSRWDPEALASRSLAVAGLVLIIVDLVVGCACQFQGRVVVSLVVQTLVVVLGLLLFAYYRHRAWDARFDMLLVVTREREHR